MNRARADTRGILSALFDFSFTSFVTLKLVRYAYMIVVAAAGFVAFVVLLLGLSRGVAVGFGGLILAGLGFLFTITLARIGLEAAAVFFRMADHAAEIADQAAQIALNSRASPKSIESSESAAKSVLTGDRPRRNYGIGTTLLITAGLLTAPQGVAAAQWWDKVANPQFDVPITHPPDVILTGVTKVSVLEFGGDSRCGLELAERLAIAIRETGKFEVIDRSSISAILQEQGLQSSGAFNQAEAIKLGQLVGPAAIVAGKVARCSVEHSPLLNAGQYKDANGYLHTKYVRRTTAHMTASVSLIDLTTGKVYAGNLLDVSHPLENEAFDGAPEAPSADAAQTQMYHRAVWEVKKMILPWQETVKLTVYKDGKCGLNQTVEQIKRGDFVLAADRLRASLERSCEAPNDKSLLSKARYNLGIALAYSNQPQEGLRELQASADLRSTDIANKAIQAVRKMLALDAQRRVKEVAAADLGAATDSAAQRASAALLTNGDVIDMVKAKLSDAIIVGKIKASSCKFDTSPRGLIALKAAGASDNVVVAVTETAEAKCK